MIEERIEYVNGIAISPEKYKGITSEEVKQAKIKEQQEALGKNTPLVLR